MEFRHVSVLLDETITNVVTKSDGIYVDGTLGGGGHSYELLERTSPVGKLIGIDRDSQALSAAKDKLGKYGERVTLVHDNFNNIKHVLEKYHTEKITGAILDLGVSSFQLDTPERGFGYMHDSPLDMRMNTSDYMSAYNVVNEYSEWELFRVIQDYGEEMWAKRIAQFIVREREKKKIETTNELIEIIKMAVPAAARRTGPHPARRTFQAIRIEVNGELQHLEQAVRDFIDVLEPGGRLGIITFHSLEDRIVKRTYKQLESPCICSPQAPICVCGLKPTVKIITKKAILPSDIELEENPRSKSAKLRVIQKL